jgi:hypothetical protein
MKTTTKRRASAKRIYRLEAQLSGAEVSPQEWKFLGTFSTIESPLANIPASHRLYAEVGISCVHRIVNTTTGEILYTE